MRNFTFSLSTDSGERGWSTNRVNQDFVDSIEQMREDEKEVGWRTLIRRIDFRDIARLFPFYDWKGYGNGLHIKDDYAVSFHRSKYNGQRCYYIQHSAFEYIFMAQNEAA